MNIKRPTGEFEKSIGVVIEELPNCAILKMDGREFKIQAEGFGYDENFKPKGFFLYKDTLRSVNDEPMDKKAINKLIEYYTEYYTKQGLEVRVE